MTDAEKIAYLEEKIKQLEGFYGTTLRNNRLIVDGYFRSLENTTNHSDAEWYLKEIIRIGRQSEFKEDVEKAISLLSLFEAFE